jgi:hypothetical protein
MAALATFTAHGAPSRSLRKCTLLIVAWLCPAACHATDSASPSNSDAATDGIADSATPNEGSTTLACAAPGPAGVDWFESFPGAPTFATSLPRNLSIIGRMQGGVCVFDADRDGKLDLFFPSFDEANAKSTSTLYRATESAGWSEESGLRGLGDTGEAVGCLAFDVDGDGDDDLLTVGIGTLRLFLNDAGVFTDVSARIGATPYGSTDSLSAAVAFDADGDGDLDLAIASYGRYVVDTPSDCGSTDCRLAPQTYKGGTTALLLQNSDGTFTDATASLGTFSEPGLVLLATDLDDDGHVDLFVGNDLDVHPDRYFKGDGAGHFSEVGKAFGVAFNASLQGVSSMSATDPDLDVDGHIDLVQSNFEQDTDELYACHGAAGCTDQTFAIGWTTPLPNLRWGQGTFDFDDDGIPDLLEGQGNLEVPAELVLPATVTPPVLGPMAGPLLLWTRPDTKSPLTLAPAIDGLDIPAAGRGLVAADLDGDGMLDAVVGVSEGAPLVLHNLRAGCGHHVDVDLHGKGKNTRGIGSKITVTVGSQSWPSIVHAGSGYHGSGPPRVHVGVGAATTIDSITVRWPSGSTSTQSSIAVDQVVSFTEP